MIAAASPGSAKLAGQCGNGLVSTASSNKVVAQFREIRRKWEAEVRAAHGLLGSLRKKMPRRTAQDRDGPLADWALSGVSQELPSPFYFEQAARTVSEDQVAKNVICGHDPRKHLEAIQKYLDAGFDHVYVHQVGPEQEGFIDFYRREILTNFARRNGCAAQSKMQSHASWHSFGFGG